MALGEDKIVRPGSGGGGGGGGAADFPWSPSLRVMARRRMGMATLTDEGLLYSRFHKLATERKVALASRGLEIENVFIDDLFDDARRHGVEPTEYHAYLRREIPSPTPGRDDDGGGGGGGGRFGGGTRFGVAVGGGAADLSATAPAAFGTRKGHGGAAAAGGGGGSGRKVTVLKKFSMPFTHLAAADRAGAGAGAAGGIGGGGGGLLSASQLLAASARPGDGRRRASAQRGRGRGPATRAR